MRYAITVKKCSLSIATERKIEKQVKKLTQFLPGFSNQALFLEIVMRKHRKKSFDHLEKRLIGNNEITPAGNRPLLDSPVYYDGTIKLILPKKPLIVHMLGKTADNALLNGFHTLIKELKIYKGKHFQENSEYSSQETIRKEWHTV